MEAFKKLWISEQTLKALEKKGFETPSPIQEQVIPLLLAGDEDIIGQAATGTGKTAAFGIPLIEKLTPKRKPQALILAPTRELATQVAQEIDSFQSGPAKDQLKITPIYGGQSYDIQIRALKRGTDIIVGTPGRVIDHLKRRTLDLSNVEKFILDEADEMLNMGFIDDIQKIFEEIKKDSQVLLFSATMPKTILRVAEKYMGKYQLVQVKKEQLTTTQTEQIYFEVNERDKFEALCRIADIEPDFYAIVFCKTKYTADTITASLIEKGYDAQALHGDIQQKQRERILKLFKNKKINILVATDVAARGIDVDNVSHVINYSLPQDPESYVHRVGRTGRAGNTGTAITFVSPQEYKGMMYVQRITNTEIKKAEIPEIDDIISTRKAKLKKTLDFITQGEGYKKFMPIAQELVESTDPVEVISALLKIHYQDVFDKEQYQTINKVTIDTTGKTRLFIALGRKDGFSPKSLVEHIQKETNVSQKVIDDVKVLEDFSFITVPFVDAEVIIKIFEKKRASGERPLISKAKDDRSNNRRWRSSGWRRENSRGGDRNRSRENRRWGDRERNWNYRKTNRNNNSRSRDRNSRR